MYCNYCNLLYYTIKKVSRTKEINNNFANVLEQQKDIAREAGEIKQSLNKDSINYQVRLNAYHNKTVESIAEIYVALIQIRDSAKDLVFSGTDGDNKKYEKYRKMLDEFRNTFDTRKIWVPKRWLKDIEAVASEIDNRLPKLMLACIKTDNPSNSSEKELIEAQGVQDKFYDFIYKKIGITCDQLAEKIANEINVENA